MGQEPDEIREEIERTRGRMSDTVDAIAYKADVPNRVHDAVNEKVDSVKSSITGAVGSVRDAMPDSGDLREMTTNAMSAVRENPLGVLFGAAAIGFVIGSLLPSTDIENERLGTIGDRIRQTAQTTGGELLEQGKAVIRETIDASTDAAQQSAKQHGQEVAEIAMQGIQGRQT